MGFVAYDVGIRESWVSDNIGDFLTMAGPIPRGKLWRKFGRRLEVYIPPKAFILAHKLVAGREKDMKVTAWIWYTRQEEKTQLWRRDRMRTAQPYTMHHAFEKICEGQGP